MKYLSCVIIILNLLVLGCGTESGKEGSVIRIDYQDAKIEEGDWVEIDSFRFEHIGKREEAKRVRFPLPSNQVFVDSVGGRDYTRDYNSKTVPVLMARHLENINDDLPPEKRFEVGNYALLSYRGIIEIAKKDSSKMTIQNSNEYDAKIEVVN